MKRQLINLHNHSHYSILDGISTPEEIVKKTVELGLPAVAITDHGNMNNYGIFYNDARKNNVKPILGCEFYHVRSLPKWNKIYARVKEGVDKGGNKLSSKRQKAAYKSLQSRFHVVLLVKNLLGFQNINRLIYYSYKNLYYKPRIDRKYIERFSEGLICTSACMGGEFGRMIQKGKMDKVVESIDFFKSTFKSDFYMEIMFNEREEQREHNQAIIELAKSYKIKVIVTQDSHYLNAGDNNPQQSMLLLQGKNTWEDVRRKEEKIKKGELVEDDPDNKVWTPGVKNIYYKSISEVWNDCQKYHPEINKKDFCKWCDNTVEIAEKIESFDLDTSLKLKDIYPDIDNKNEFLTKLCKKGMKEKGWRGNKKYKDRLNFELQVIFNMKMSKYFLTVYSIVKNAKVKMLVGPGRGSAAGSLVVYLLGITDIDPIRHELYFERFLNIERVDIPDIDVDFEDNTQIKKDLIEKYGSDVACISSYSTFQISGLLKDLGRVHKIENPFFFDRLNKRIRTELEQSKDHIGQENKYMQVSYDEAMKYSPSFEAFMEKHKEINYDFITLLGKIRHVGCHAAGVVISDELMINQPTMILKDMMQTSLSEGTREKTLSEFGFVKIDILGLDTLRVMRLCLDYISKESSNSFIAMYNKLIHPDIIDLKDEKVYDFVFKEVIRKNSKKANKELSLNGIFQFETYSMKQMIRKVKPDCFDDLVAIVALFRPGPLKGGTAFEYGDRKRGKIEMSYYNNDIVKKILKKTYGILIFQEQIMEIGHHLGGLPLSKTNVLRKLLDTGGRKLDEEAKEKLNKMKKPFFSNATENGMEDGDLNKLWDDMVAFSGYGFNKSHALSYAMISYQGSWLKTYYPLEFYCALLNIEKSDDYGRVIEEMKVNKIEILPVDINKSQKDFSISEGKIYWGICKISGIGEKAADEIIKARDKKRFKGLKDFLTRNISWRICNSRIVNIMINIGMFDSFRSGIRNVLLQIYDEFYVSVKGHRKNKTNEYTEDREDNINKRFKELLKDSSFNNDLSEDKKLKNELQYYKFNLMYSPFKLNNRATKIRTLRKNEKAGGFDDDCEYVIVQFQDLNRFKDKNKADMCFLKLLDFNGKSMQGLIFSSDYHEKEIKAGNIYLIKGSIGDKFIVKTYLNIDERMNN